MEATSADSLLTDHLEPRYKRDRESVCTENENPLLSASPTVFLEINGVLTGCVCDTGAETSLIPTEYYASSFSKC